MDEIVQPAMPDSTPTINSGGNNSAPDISKTTLVVLVMLTLIISIIGTWSVLNEVNNVRTYQKVSGPQTAKVSLTLASSNDIPAVSNPAPLTTGHVSLNLASTN